MSQSAFDTIAGGLKPIGVDTKLKLYNRIVKFSAYGVSAVLAVLLLDAALPPLIADQSDRAILDARVTLLTTPIAGEVSVIDTTASNKTASRLPVAEVRNGRVDETTLLALSSKADELHEKVVTAANKKESDQRYVRSLDAEIASEKNALVAQLRDEVTGLQAKVGSAQADVETKEALHDRQAQLLARDVVSKDMLKPVTHELAGAGSLRASAKAQLAAAQAQLDAVQGGVFVGDNLVGLSTLAQKRRDVAFDADRETIEESSARSEFDDMTRLRDREQARVDSLKVASLSAPPNREMFQAAVAQGRHVNAGDSLATLVDCKSVFAVAIFSYRQAAALSVGTRMEISGAGFGNSVGGTVQDIIPKSNDKTDELYAVPFPQTERREMYVVVRPDSDEDLRTRDRNGDAGGSCPVGKWVTVSRSDGWVPSMSVLWQNASSMISRTVVSVAGSPVTNAHAKAARPNS